MNRFIELNGMHINTADIRRYWLNKDGLNVETTDDEVCTVHPEWEARYVVDELSGHNHIVQIIPVPDGIMLKFKEDDGTISKHRPLCLALTLDGSVKFVDMCVDGETGFPDEFSNFEGIDIKEGY